MKLFGGQVGLEREFPRAGAGLTTHLPDFHSGGRQAEDQDIVPTPFASLVVTSSELRGRIGIASDMARRRDVLLQHFDPRGVWHADHPYAAPQRNKWSTIAASKKVLG